MKIKTGMEFPTLSTQRIPALPPPLSPRSLSINLIEEKKIKKLREWKPIQGEIESES